MADGDERPGILATIVATPFKIFIALCLGILSAIRPFAPRLVPALVCSLFIPLVLLLSASAGWVVWSSLSVSWQVPLYLQFGDGISPYAFVSLPTLVPQQRYDISVDLVLPYTESNLLLGNFMASLTLSTLSNRTLAHVRRPAIIPPPKPRIFSWNPTSANVKVPLIESFLASKSNLAANVQIGRGDGWTTLGLGQGREVNVIAASLRGLAVPHGIRGLAMRFPLFSALASAGIFLIILSAILGTCVLPLLLPPQEDNDEFQAMADAKRRGPNPPSGAQVPAESRRRRRSKGSRERPVSIYFLLNIHAFDLTHAIKQIKKEAPVENLPPVTDEDLTRGLRRRSSKLVVGSSEGEK
ncbi:hypothetical protein GALMADRAFT_52054 [Galerina marginata CBS 339.88]|uniref:Uncharacterized protein n=1 Tax=Galerina marginata (strain CBS 339.88) TaxID=685588 RepID=A0A067TQ53_GALM3|nr:hypothetical protein GALMADRAFT_52054 [Galerina marginata CBS 339.88]